MASGREGLVEAAVAQPQPVVDKEEGCARPPVDNSSSPPASINVHHSVDADETSVITDINTVQYERQNSSAKVYPSPAAVAYGIPDEMVQESRSLRGAAEGEKQSNGEATAEQSDRKLATTNSSAAEHMSSPTVEALSTAHWKASIRRKLAPVPPGETVSSTQPENLSEESKTEDVQAAIVPMPPRSIRFCQSSKTDVSSVITDINTVQYERHSSNNLHPATAARGIPDEALLERDEAEGNPSHKLNCHEEEDSAMAPGEAEPKRDSGNSVSQWFATSRTNPVPVPPGDGNSTVAASSTASQTLQIGKGATKAPGYGTPFAATTTTKAAFLLDVSNSAPRPDPSNTSDRPPTEPGAVHIATSIGDGSNTNRYTDEEEAMTSQAPQQPQGASTASVDGTAEPLFTATLVSEESDKHLPKDDLDVIEAVPAMEGFVAIVKNKRFKYVVGCFVLVLLAVVIPVSVLVRSNNKGDDGPVRVVALNILECGTYRSKQSDYRGNISRTISGRTCQQWDSAAPHEHDLAFNLDGRETHGLDFNYCRNPEEKSDTGAWCYTTDPSVVAEPCAVPYCDAARKFEQKKHCGTMEGGQVDYRGNMSMTASGKECQRWDKQTPHGHSRTGNNFPFSGLEENYCRNPDGEPGVWCYTNTSESRWEQCDVLACEAEVSPWDQPLTTPRRQCGEVANRQSDYRGSIHMTANGTSCVNWARSGAAKVDGYTHVQYPWAGLVHNFCRNPDGHRDQAWCYLEDDSWAYCDVPWCDVECGPFNTRKEDYRGTKSTTISEEACLPWLDNVDHLVSAPSNTTDLDDWLTAWGLQSNACRNPEGDKETAWCFVAYNDTEDVSWEYCSICEVKDTSTEVGNRTCGSLSLSQEDYRGNMDTTSNNLTCQAWGSQQPHIHKLTPEERPTAGLDGNYCRNPDNSQRAWCYTTNPDVLWDYCNVPNCNETLADV